MERRVAREIDVRAVGRDGPAAPQAIAAIAKTASAEVLRGDADGTEIRRVDRGPPIALDHVARAEAPQYGCHAERAEPTGQRPAVGDAPNGVCVEMIVVIVRLQHDVDVGQCVDERSPALGAASCRAADWVSVSVWLRRRNATG